MEEQYLDDPSADESDSGDRPIKQDPTSNDEHSEDVFSEPLCETETRQRSMKTTDKQYIRIVEFMERHPAFATGLIKCAGGKRKSDQLWERLTLHLNRIGPPIRTSDKWKKVRILVRPSLFHHVLSDLQITWAACDYENSLTTHSSSNLRQRDEG